MYIVVVNDEQQYSVWPAGRELPPGWRDVGRGGTKDECLAYIEKVWTSTVPLSLQRSAGRGGMSPEVSGSPAPWPAL